MKKILASVLAVIMLCSIMCMGISATVLYPIHNPMGDGEFPATYAVLPIANQRNLIVKFFDYEKAITPVETQIIKLAPDLYGYDSVAIIPMDTEGLAALSDETFTDQKIGQKKALDFNTIYAIDWAKGETELYDAVIYVEIPDEFVTYPEQDVAVITASSSWRVNYTVLDEEVFAALTPADEEEAPAVEDIVEEEVVVEEETAVEETTEDVAPAEEVSLDIDAILAGVQAVLGDTFDLSTIIADANGNGTIEMDELTSAYFALDSFELPAEIVAAIEAAVDSILGDYIDAVLGSLVIVEVVPVENTPAA